MCIKVVIDSAANQVRGHLSGWQFEVVARPGGPHPEMLVPSPVEPGPQETPLAVVEISPAIAEITEDLSLGIGSEEDPAIVPGVIAAFDLKPTREQKALLETLELPKFRNFNAPTAPRFYPEARAEPAILNQYL